MLASRLFTNRTRPDTMILQEQRQTMEDTVRYIEDWQESGSSDLERWTGGTR